MSYGDYGRFEPKTQENMNIPEKTGTPPYDEKQVNPKTSVVSRPILNNSQQKLPEEAESLAGRRLTKEELPSNGASEKAHAVGTPILIQNNADDGVDFMQQNGVYLQPNVHPFGEAAPFQRDFSSMNADELEAALAEDLTEEEINVVLQRLDELSGASIQEVVDREEKAINLEEEAVQLDSDDEQMVQASEEAVVESSEAEREVVHSENIVASAKIAKKDEISWTVKDLRFIDLATGTLIRFDEEMLRSEPGKSLAFFNKETGVLVVPLGCEDLFSIGQLVDTDEGPVRIRKVRIFTDQERAEIDNFIAGHFNPAVDDDEEQKKRASHSGSSSMPYREMDTSSRASLHRGEHSPIRERERLSQSSSASYENSSKKFLDEALEKNYKKIQMELKRLEKEILSHEILIEGIKRDGQVESIVKLTQQLQDFQAENRLLDARYDVALQKFLDSIKGNEGKVPLPLLKKFKEIQIEFVRLGKLIPKEISGSKDAVKVMGQVVAMKREVLVMMSGLITAAGRLYAGGNAERQPSKA